MDVTYRGYLCELIGGSRQRNQIMIRYLDRDVNVSVDDPELEVPNNIQLWLERNYRLVFKDPFKLDPIINTEE